MVYSIWMCVNIACLNKKNTWLNKKHIPQPKKCSVPRVWTDSNCHKPPGLSSIFRHIQIISCWIYLGKLSYFTHLNSSAIGGWFPLLTIIPGFGRSEVVIIYPYIYIYYIIYIYIPTINNMIFLDIPSRAGFIPHGCWWTPHFSKPRSLPNGVGWWDWAWGILSRHYFFNR